MARKWIAIVVIVGLLITGLVAVIVLKRRSNQPEYLLNRLRYETDNRDELIMKLQLSRGDTVGAMIRAVHDTTAPEEYRALVLELLFRQYQRESDKRIRELAMQSLHDPSAVVRKQAVEGIATFGENRMQLGLVDLINDPGPEVRRQVYMVFAAHDYRPQSGLWEQMSRTEIDQMVEKCQKQLPMEKDLEIRLLCRSVLGRYIQLLCNEATESLQSADSDKAEKLLLKALSIDPENEAAKIRLVRFHLTMGDREKAIELARTIGALVVIPELSEVPLIDGDPADPAWEHGFISDRSYLTNSLWVERLSDTKSIFKVGYHDNTLYVAVVGYEDDLHDLVVKRTRRDDNIWRDDCAEIFLDPDNTEGFAYQFIINPLGVMHDIYQRRDGENFNSEYAAQVFHDRGYWACEFAIDASEMNGATINEDSLWSMNIMRTRIGGASQQCAWWPTFGTSLHFHYYPIAVFD